MVSLCILCGKYRDCVALVTRNNRMAPLCGLCGKYRDCVADVHT
jgi:hypothetical protein